MARHVIGTQAGLLHLSWGKPEWLDARIFGRRGGRPARVPGDAGLESHGGDLAGELDAGCPPDRVDPRALAFPSPVYPRRAARRNRGADMHDRARADTAAVGAPDTRSLAVFLTSRARGAQVVATVSWRLPLARAGGPVALCIGHTPRRGLCRRSSLEPSRAACTGWSHGLAGDACTGTWAYLVAALLSCPIHRNGERASGDAPAARPHSPDSCAPEATPQRSAEPDSPRGERVACAGDLRGLAMRVPPRRPRRGRGHRIECPEGEYLVGDRGR